MKIIYEVVVLLINQVEEIKSLKKLVVKSLSDGDDGETESNGYNK
jgi:hypothetical protein